MSGFVDVRVEGVVETLDYFKLLANDQFPFAFSKACNDMAFMVRDAEQKKMVEVFDRPKPATIRNMRVWLGNKNRPGASIFFDQLFNGDEYMAVQVDGGERPMKRSEQILGRYWVPGAGAQLDQYGNMKGSQIVQILSRLNKFAEVGFQANQTKRTKGMRAGQDAEYFMLTQKVNGLVPGVYMRVDKSHGQMMVARALATRPKGVKKAEIKAKMAKALKRGVIPVMIFVSRPPDYKKRFPFHEVAQQTIAANWEQVMGNAVDVALKTGGYKAGWASS